MRTTIRINDELLRKAKKRAAETDRTLTQVVEDALRREVEAGDYTADSETIELPSDGEGGLQPGVDLDDTSSLLDRIGGVS
jgi:predicted transcriptional regulator